MERQSHSFAEVVAHAGEGVGKGSEGVKSFVDSWVVN